MTIVYMLDKGSYSDYHVTGICSTRENAELMAKELGSEITEVTLDECVDLLKQGYKSYYLLMLKDGTVEGLYENAIYNEPYFRRFNRFGPARLDVLNNAVVYSPIVPNTEYLSVSVHAKSPEHAIKIANEHRLQLLATNEWK